MQRRDHIRLMADYNQWMNSRLLEAATSLDAAALSADRGAFFGSILGTLNHLLVADILWLKRFATHPTGFMALAPVQQMPDPSALDQILCPTLDEVRALRNTLDATILDWSKTLTESDLDVALAYRSTKGVPATRNFFALLTHFFNHQTHHRGQITTLLSQTGVDMGVTDLLWRIPDLDEAP